MQLTVSDYDRALQILRDGGYDAITEDAVIINVKDGPGALAKPGDSSTVAWISAAWVCCIVKQVKPVAISMDRTDLGMELISDLLVNRSA